MGGIGGILLSFRQMQGQTANCCKLQSANFKLVSAVAKGIYHMFEWRYQYKQLKNGSGIQAQNSKCV